jgi:hypothetical protein
MTPKNARKVQPLLRARRNKTDPDFRSRTKDGFVGLRTTTPIVSVCFLVSPNFPDAPLVVLPCDAKKLFHG